MDFYITCQFNILTRDFHSPWSRNKPFLNISNTVLANVVMNEHDDFSWLA